MMIPYFLIFAIVIALLHLSRILKKQRIISNIIVVTAIMILSLFASMRNLSVGTDVLIYAEPYINYIKLYGFQWLLDNSNCELFYAILTNTIVLINGNIRTLLFIITFLISGLMYKYACDNQNENDVVLMFSVYLFVFLGISFNLIRQSIAMALIMIGQKYLKEKKNLKFLLLCIIATQFHSSAILMIVLLPIYRIIDSKKSKVYQMSILIGLTCCVFLLPHLISMLEIISPKYTYTYLSKYLLPHITINYVWSILKLIIIFVVFIFMKPKKNSNINIKYFNFCKFLLIIDFISFQFGAVIRLSERFSFYFMLISYSYLLPLIKEPFIVSKKSSRKTIFSSVILYIILITIFIIVFGFLKISSIVPYYI